MYVNLALSMYSEFTNCVFSCCDIFTVDQVIQPHLEVTAVLEFIVKALRIHLL